MKSEILGVSSDAFFQNIHDKENNIVQKSRSIGEFDLKEIYKEDITGKTIIDLGCNCGRYCFESIKLGAKHCTGVDISDYMTKFIDMLGEPNVKYIRNDRMEFTPDGTYDIALLIDLTCYFSIDQIIGLIDKVLSYKTGHFYIVDIFSGEDHLKKFQIIKHLENLGKEFDIYTVNKVSEEYINKCTVIKISS